MKNLKFRGLSCLLFTLLSGIFAAPGVLLNFSTLAQEMDAQTYRQVATMGQGRLKRASWGADGQTIQIITDMGAWLYTSDFELLNTFESQSLADFSPDGKYVATTSLDSSQLYIRDTRTGALLQTIDLAPEPLREVVTALAWSPDASYIAIAIDQSVMVFDWHSKEMLTSFTDDTFVTHLSWRPDGMQLAISQYGPLQIIDPFHSQAETTVTIDSGSSMAMWSPDQQTLSTVYIDNGYGRMENNIKFWSEDGQTLKLTIQEPVATALAWSPDGRVIATGMRSHNDDSVSFWDTQTGQLIDHLPQGPYRKQFLSVEWSSDETQIMTASADNVVRIYDWPLQQQKLPRKLLAGQDSITGLAWNGDGTGIVSVSEDGNVVIRDAITGLTVTYLEAPESQLKSVTWNALTSQIAFAGGSIAVYTWDMLADEPPEIKGQHGENRDNPTSPEVTEVVYSPDGQWLASAAPDYLIKLWSDDADRTRTLGPLERAAFSLDWSADGHQLAYNSGMVYIYDVESEATRSFECDANDIVGAVALSPDGHYLAAANANRGMCVWNTETQTLMTDIPLLEKMNTNHIMVRDMDWNPDSRLLALIILQSRMESGSEIREWFVEVWSMPAGTQLFSVQIKAPPTQIVWSPDGMRLAAGMQNGLIHIWQRE